MSLQAGLWKQTFAKEQSRGEVSGSHKSQQIVAMTTVLSAGTAFSLVHWLPWGHSLQVPLDLLFHPYQKSQDLAEFMLGIWCILRWERICFMQKFTGFSAEEYPCTPYLPPSGKSLFICTRHSWGSGYIPNWVSLVSHSEGPVKCKLHTLDQWHPHCSVWAIVSCWEDGSS